MEKQRLNVHHTLFPKRDYKSIERVSLRNHPAMKIRTFVDDHNELHARVRPPELIIPDLARAALQRLDTLPNTQSDFEKFYSLNEYFDRISKRMGKLAINAGNIHENFDEQLKYIRYIENERTL